MARRFSEENIASSGFSLPESSRDGASNTPGATTKATTRFSRYASPDTNTKARKSATKNSTTARRPPVMAPKQTTTGVKQAASNKKKTSNTAISPRKPTMLAPKGYTVRPIVPASKAELLPVARAMNREDFAPRLKKLFDPEREAALEAIETGIYIGWRCPEFKHDCIRVGKSSKCFCGHFLSEHSSYHGNSVNVPCRACECKAFAFVPARTEEVGEWWLQRRRNFDPSTWRAKCKCKHTHEEHSPTNPRRCRVKSCPCAGFHSAFLCAACDRHWEQHETVFESAEHRRLEGIPYGQHYLPFHEMPELRNVVLTGREDDSSMYEELASGPYAIPENRPSALALQLRGDSTKKPR
ncbi:Hypothetical predicted protein [Paramuricea clavata]|uniref:Uncharacterized protein n=1 Tax=Paramuricea clavata TaxID=317549 RepID=A0A6S7HGK8_PARCT|nr:Hypothetical predicted protein [Paramuricea clavata]